MDIYKYTVRDARGVLVEGEQEASSSVALAKALRDQGMTVITVEKGGGGLLDIDVMAYVRGVKRSEILAFTIQLSTLISSGLPIVTSLEGVRDQAENPVLKSVLSSIIEDVQGGLPLSDALERHPKVFDALYVSMVRVGETAGILDESLERLALLLENQLALISDIRSSLIYPAILILVAIAVVGFLVVYVLPKFVALFAQLNIELPEITQALVSIASFLGTYWDMMLLIIAAVLIGLWQYLRTEQGMETRDNLLIKVPPCRGIVRKLMVARFATTFSALSRTGVPILRSFDVLETTLGNRVYARAIHDVGNAVEQGEPIAGTLSESGLFPSMLVRMVNAGEESGNLDKMLEKSGRYFEREVRNEIKVLVSLIEPAIIIGMAVIVAFIVLSIMLPLLDLTQMVR